MNYERVSYRPEGSARNRVVILRDPREVSLGCAGRALVGTEVDRFGDEVAPRGVDERRHVIATALVRRRVPLRMNLKYAELERAEP